MKRLVLQRFWNAPDDKGLFGRMWFDGAPSKWWFTVEKPWKQNNPSISCIPKGTYALRHGTFNKGGGYSDLEFVSVAGRENIEIHSANFAHELKGCIAPGLGMDSGMYAVSGSRSALKEILERIGGDTEISIEVGGIV